MTTALFTPPTIGANGPPDVTTAPISAYRYMDAKRQVINAEATARPLIRLWDSDMQYIGTVSSEQSVEAEEMLHDTGLGDIVLTNVDPLIMALQTDVYLANDLHITIDPYRNNRNWRWRWGGKVTNVRVKRGSDGLTTATLECSHNREHWKHLLFAATPFCPPEVQPLRAWLNVGNTRTITASTGFINLARNYYPLLALPSNVFNPGAWVGNASSLANLNPLNWPVQMAYVNAALDQSRMSVLMSRWSPAHAVTLENLKDSGCNVRAYTWLTEDADSPHPELAALVGQAAARPTRNCVVLAVEDKSGVTGPTGTALDGAINLVGITGDDLITEFTYDANQIGTPTDPIDGTTSSGLIQSHLIRKWLDVNPAIPNLVFRDGEQSAIIQSERAMFRSKAQSIATGGKSPGWVNEMQTFAIRYALSELSAVVDEFVAGASQTPGSPGLDNLYQGELDNILLAYMRFTDATRVLQTGPYGFLEEFEQGNGTAYAISSELTIRQGHWKTRAYQAFKVSILNNRPNTIYYDFDLGDRAMFEIDGIFYVDQITATKLHYDRETFKKYDISIGDDSELESPLARVSRSATTFWNALAMIAGGGSLF